MKSVQDREKNTYYIGDSNEIKATYRSIWKAYVRGNTQIKPKFNRLPKLADWRRCYGLRVNNKGYMTVVNSDLLLYMLLDNGKIKE